ncbi:MAG: YaiI/YqxD family protein [Rhodobacteraceae bacterium]|nr:YaiI/YqxD family protein [Paracoccaceae bacterium]
MACIYVDADACPVRAEAELTALRHGVALKLVTNGGLRPVDHPLVQVVYVDQGADAADRWIAERAGPGDVVVTSDMPLAARAVEAGAQVLRHDGSVLTAANIGNALAMRDLMADLRAADPFRQGGGRSFSRADRARFAEALDAALKRAKRTGPAPGLAGTKTKP